MPKFLDDNGLLYFWQKIKSKFVTNVAYDSTNKKLTKTINGTTSDIVAVSTLKTALNLSKTDVGLGNVDNTSDANKPISTATQTALNGKVDAVSGKGLSANDFTTTLKNKLDGIAAGAEVNQNAFSNVKVGSTTVAADAKIDTLELAAGDNITLTPDATNDKVTIAATVPTKSSTTPLANGTASAGSETAYAAGDHVHPAQTNITGNAATATRLYSGHTIDGVPFTGASDIMHFGVSSTDGRHKTVTCTGFKYVHGARITVLFTGNPNASEETGNCTLSVNNLSEVPIQFNFGSSLTPQAANDYKLLQKNFAYEFVYYSQDSTTCFMMLSARDTNTTYMSASSESSGLMSSGDKIKLDKLVFDSNNLIDSSILPSYVDDVIEAYARSGQTALSSTWLATGSASGTVITPESGKIYVLMADSGNYAANTQFRWSGTAYVKLNDGGVSAITNSEIDTILAA